MTLDNLIQPLIEQGVLGVLVVILLLAFNKIFKKLISVVENNTKAFIEFSVIQKTTNENAVEANKSIDALKVDSNNHFKKTDEIYSNLMGNLNR